MAPDQSSDLFNEYYYKHCCGAEYVRSDLFVRFFDGIAERIVSDFAPQSTVDAGCAIGMLVEALRKRSVNASGFDVSEYAVNQAPTDLKPYVFKESILNPKAVSGLFDLVTCIEVVEHLPPEAADAAVANLCGWGDRILFSSSPEDYSEVTHFNVQSPGYWVEKFARHGFLPVLDYDARYIAPWTMLLERQRSPLWPVVVRQFADKLWLTDKEILALRATANQLQTQYAQLQQEYAQLQRDYAQRQQEYIESLRGPWGMWPRSKHAVSILRSDGVIALVRASWQWLSKSWRNKKQKES